jgi:hypothetical protein
MKIFGNIIDDKIYSFFASKTDYEAIVGIDFGSSASGYAFSLKEIKDKNDDNEPSKYCQIIYGQIQGASVNHKVPTEIILDKENNVMAFGAECVKHIKTKGLEDFLYFKGIKMHLYENKPKIKAQNSDKELPLELVIQKVLETIKKLAIEEISKSRPHLEKETKKIKWIVTVPAIWDERQKDIMWKSCEKSGLIDENTDRSLFFTLEPEAASMYCAINKDIDRTYFEKGSYYIVCDLGGGTGDIVAHLVGSNNKLNEISPSCGGAFGSNEIDKSIFKDVIMKLFGCQDFYTFCSKYKKYNKDVFDEGELYNEWSEFEREIKDFKEGATNENIENNDNYCINCSMFQDIYDSNKKIDINDLVKEYNDNVEDRELILNVKKNKRRWIVEFPYKIINHYMKIQANSICKIINEINKNENIKTIIFVGGYSNNKIILKLIKNGLKKIKIILHPSNPSLAIMEGAVLFGIEPSAIDVRIAKFTIGTKMNDVWNEKKHAKKGEKFFNEDEKKWFCKDCFVKFIEINQKLNYGQEIVNGSYMCYKDQTCVTFEFYKTKKKNPVFAFEEGLIKIGECTLDLGEAFEEYEDRKLKTIMKFGGTFIDVTGIHLKTGKTVKAILTFD